MLKNLHQSPEIHGNSTQNGYQRNYYGQCQKPYNNSRKHQRIVKNYPLICFKIMLPYIWNFIENKKLWLTSIFDVSLS